MKRIISLTLCFIMVFTLCQPVFAANTITWNGEAGDGSWHTAGNWDPAQVPVDGDYVIIPGSSVVEYVYDYTSVCLDCAGNLTVFGGTLELAYGNSSLTSGKLDGAGDITIATGGNLLWSGGSIEGDGAFTVNSGAQLNIETENNVTLSRPLVNNGQVVVNNGEVYFVGGSEGTGTVEVSNGAYVSFEQSAYNFGGNFVNGGDVSIWHTSSAFFNAGYRQENTGTLALKVWGSESDEYCKIAVGGEAELDGILEIDFMYDYVPSPGDTFEIMTYGSRTGEFSSIINNMEEDGIILEPAYTATGLILTVSSGEEPGGYMCKVDDVGYDTLDGALEAVMYGGTIQLLKNIDYDGGIFISGADITFDLNGFTLNVNNSTGPGLKVKGGSDVEYINEETTGSFNVNGYEFGVWAEDAGTVVRVTSATSGGSTAYNYAVFAKNGAEVIVENDVNVSGQFSTGISANGGVVTVGGSVTLTDGNVGFGIEAFNDGSVIVEGSVTAIGTSSKGISAMNADISIGGDVVGEYIGVSSKASTIQITGNVASSAPAEAGPSYGIAAKDGCEITIGGNVESNCTGISIMEVSVEDPELYNHSEIFIDGEITAPEYIIIWDTPLDFEDYSDITPSGYRIYDAYADISDGGFPLGIVYVKEEGMVPVVPTAPQNFTAVPGDGQVVLSWTAPESNGGSAVIRYEVSSDNGSTWVTASTNTSHTYTGLTNGTTYTFKVRAVNIAGNGAEASATATPVTPEFAGGNGSEEEPYLIETVDHLNNVRNYLGTENNDKHFKLSANLNLDVAPYNNGAGWVPIGTSTDPFTGTFDGDEHIISGLFINKDGVWNVRIPSGLFGYTGTDAEIRNLTLENLDITGCYYVGGLAGNNNGKITNVSGSGSVTGEWDTGGLTGRNNGTITDSSFTGTVTGDDKIEYGDWTGGLVGYNLGTITNCQTNAAVVSGGDSIGGLVGENYEGTITESYSSGTITGWDSVGGLVGSNCGEITACYSLCTVDGNSDVGGLVGGNSGPISDSYAAGSVNGNMRKGGLAGSNIDAVVSNCYWDTEASGQSTSACGTGKSTANMKEQATYVGWDFDDVWDINGSDNNGYPFLRWQEYEAAPTVPTSPQDFTATPGNGQVILSWTAPASDGGSAIIRYEVSSDNGTTWATASTSTSHTFTGLINGTEYTFKVRAVNSAGPSAEASITATPVAPPVPTYTVTVTNGTGGGEYTEGATVTITANPAPEGYQFKEWQVISGGITMANPTEASTSFVMPASTVEVDATYEAIPVTTYTVTVNGSYAATTGAGSYVQGETVTINAGSRTNYSFSSWTSSEDVTFANLNSPTTTFIMPARNVTITANWTYIDGEENGDSDGEDGEDNPSGKSGDSTPSAPGTSEPPAYYADVKTEKGTEMVVPVTVSTDTGIASVNMDSDRLAQGRVNITLPSIPDVNAYSVNIPVQNLSTIDAQDTFYLYTETGSITIPSNMLAGILVTEGDKAQIMIGQGDKSDLPDDIRDTIGDRPLVQLTLSIDGEQTDWNNPNAPVTVSIPYTPAAQELANPESIVIWYIDGSGNTVSVPNGRYDPETGTVTFTTTHFSYYAVSFNQVSFKDVPKDAWYEKAVSFIAAREITLGTGSGNFSPEANLTRGQFIVMLLKTYNIDPDLNTENNFADAGSTYYTGYLAAAKRLGISAGIGNNMFAPEKEITRQEMFTLLFNALKVIDQLPGTQGGDIKTLDQFIDAGQVASWAKDAMELMVRTGTVVGSNGALYPLSTTTRAEMAQVLYNLLSK